MRGGRHASVGVLLLLAVALLLPSVVVPQPVPLPRAMAADPHLGPSAISPASSVSSGSAVNDVWASPCDPCAPGPRTDSAMVYDPATGQDIMFGGESSTGSLLNDTWAFRDGNWSQLYAPRAPAPRSGAALAYDPQTQQVILFGGASGSILWNDTWAWNGLNWTDLNLSYAPSPRTDVGMAWDPGLAELVLFGGCLTPSCNVTAGDTWEFGYGSWFEVATNPRDTPPARAEEGLTYDTADGYILMFGGFNGSAYLGDTWSFSADGWRSFEAERTPVARALPGNDLVYGGTGFPYVLLFGGWNGTEDLDDSWTFTDSEWTETTFDAVTLPPSNRSGSALAADPQVDGVVLYGGQGPDLGTAGQDTWVLGYFPDQSLNESATVGLSRVDAGAPLSFVGNATGGVPPYTYAWNFGDGSESGLVQGDHTYNAPGNYTLTLTITDDDDRQMALADYIEVSSPLRPTTVSTPHPLAWVGEEVNFSAATLGGIPPYRCSWSFGDGSLGGYGPTIQHAYAAPGTYEVGVQVQDEGGDRVDGTVNVSVSALPPVSLAVSADPSTVLVGQSVNLSARLSGGSGPFEYAWSFGDGTLGGYASTAEHTYTSAGTYLVSVHATNASAGSAAGSVTVSVLEPPSFTVSLQASLLETYPQDPVEFAAQASGGVGPYSYLWSFGDGTLGGYGAQASHAYLTPGSYPVEVQVTDADGTLANASLTEVVVAAPSLSVAGVASLSRPYVGELVDFTATASGGLGGYSYLWAFGDGTLGGTAASVQHVYAAAGNYTVSVVATDGSGDSGNTSFALTVAAAPSLHLNLTANASLGASPLVVGFSTETSGGLAPYSYAWSFGDGNTSQLADPSHLFLQPGTFSSVVTVRDSLGQTSTAAWPLQVLPGGQELALALSASLSTLLRGNTTVLTLEASGGRGAYSFSWSGLPTWCAAVGLTEVSCTPTVTGEYTIGATLRDAAGDSATSSVRLDVLASTAVPPGPAPSPWAGLTHWPGELWVLLPLLAVAMLASALVSRRGVLRRGGAAGPGLPGRPNPWVMTDPSLRRTDPANAPPPSTPSSDSLGDLF